MTTETSAPAVQDVASTPVEVTQEPSIATEVKDEAPVTEAPKEKSPYEKRIDKLTARNKDYERQFEAARKRIEELESSVKARDPEADKPKADDFNTIEEHADALADWKIAQKEKANAEPKAPSVEEIRTQERDFAQKQVAFTQKENEFRAKEPTYDQSTKVVNKLLSMADQKDPSFAAFAQTIMDADNAPQLIHYLGQNPIEAVDLFGKSPAEVEDRLLVIIDKLGAAPVNNEEEHQPDILPTPPTALKGTTRPRKTTDQMSGRELLDKYYKRK